MQLAGCNRSIARPITLVRAYGKSFVSLLLAPLVIALSVDARLAPAACIIKLPACRNADEAYLRARARTRERERKIDARVHASRIHVHEQSFLSPLALFIPPCSLPPVSSSPGKREGAHQHLRASAYNVFQPFSLSLSLYTRSRVFVH